MDSYNMMALFGWRLANTVTLEHLFTSVLYHEHHGLVGVGKSNSLGEAQELAIVAAKKAQQDYKARLDREARLALLLAALEERTADDLTMYATGMNDAIKQVRKAITCR